MLGALLLAAAACMSTPYSGQDLSSNKVDFSGFATLPRGTMKYVAYNWSARTYDHARRVQVVTDPVPEYQAGEVCPDSPALYSVSASLPLAIPSYWRRNGDHYEAKVFAHEQAGFDIRYVYFTDRPDGMTCVTSNTFNGTCKFEDVMRLCGYVLHEAMLSRYGTSTPWLP